jgi:hypothetical protein
LPSAWEAKRFIGDKDPSKRSKLIGKLLDGDGFVELLTLKWCDLLRVKSEFPIKLWPNAVHAYYHWIRTAVKENMPYDKFARALLTSSGSDFRVPPVNFLRAVRERTPEGLASAAALTFMGVRLEKWPAGKRSGMAKFFSRVSYKKTAEWKEEIVYLDPEFEGGLSIVAPDGKRMEVGRGVDPRDLFADWLLAQDNPWFAKNIVNRIWSWLVGRGLIESIDDIGSGDSPSNSELLDYLASELVSSDYDLKRIYRLILDSGVYQQSCVPNTDPGKGDAFFARYVPRRLPAEVLLDAFHQIFGGGERYSSPIPEPFTFIPGNHPSVDLFDGSMTSEFLEMFGRPPRDTGYESERGEGTSKNQRLHTLNSSHIQNLIQSSKWLRGVLRSVKGRKREAARAIYLRILSRYPTEEELKRLGVSAATSKGKGKGKGKGASGFSPRDLAWALVNTKEFQFNH